MTAWHDKLSKAYQTRRPNKFGAQKVKDSEGSFDSKGEREMHGVLKLMERGGLISNVRHHPPSIQLTKGVKWNIDWVVFELKRNRDIGVEFKGVQTDRFKVILQLWPEFGPMPLQIWGKKNGRCFLLKELEGKK